jgi:hypothetical protein
MIIVTKIAFNLTILSPNFILCGKLIQNHAILKNKWKILDLEKLINPRMI